MGDEALLARCPHGVPFAALLITYGGVPLGEVVQWLDDLPKGTTVENGTADLERCAVCHGAT